MTGVSNSGAWVPSPHVQMGARNLVLHTPKLGTQGAEAGLLTYRLQAFITRSAAVQMPWGPRRRGMVPGAHSSATEACTFWRRSTSPSTNCNGPDHTIGIEPWEN